MADVVALLIVEDSAESALLSVDVLRQGGLDCTWEQVSTASELHAALVRRPWDGLIANYDLPGLAAPAVLAILQDQGLDIPVIVVSDTPGEREAVAMIKAGAQDYVLKRDLTRLPEAVREAVRETTQPPQRGQAVDPTAASVRYQRDFSRLMVDITSRFVDLRGDNFDREVERSLGLMGEFLAVDHGYVVAFEGPHGDTQTMRVTHRWYRPDCAGTQPPAEPIPTRAFPWATEKLHQRQVIAVPNVATLPAECAVDRSSWQQFNIQAVLSVPLVQRATVVGHVGLISFSQPVWWDDNTQQLLQILAHTIAHTQERLQAEASLAQREAQSWAMLSVIPDLLVQVGADGYYRAVLNPSHPLNIVPPEKNRIGRHVNELRPADLADRKLQAIRQALATGEVQTFEQQLQVGDRLQEEEVRVMRCGTDEALLLIRDISDRKHWERALQQSEAHFRALINALPDLLVRINRAGIYLEFAANPPFAVVGDMEELVGTHVSESLPPGPAQQRLEAIRQALDTQTIQFYEHDLSTADRVQIEEVRVVPYREDEVLAVVRDISDRKRAEQQLLALNDSLEKQVADRTTALQERETRYQALMEGASDAILVADMQGNILEANHRATELFGYSSPQLTQMHQTQLHPPEQRAKVTALFQATIGQEHYQVTNVPIVRADGQRLPVDITSTMITLGNSQVVQGIFRDVSTRQRIEGENQRLRDRLEFLLSSSPAVIYSCRAEGDYGATFMSANVWQVLGYRPEQFTTDSSFWIDRIHPDDRETALTSIAQLLSSGHHCHQYRFRHGGGQYVWVEDRMQVVRNDQGQIAEVIGFWADISDRKQVEVALQASENKYRRLTENIPSMIFRFVITATGQQAFTYVSPRVQEIYEVSAAAAIEDADALFSLVVEADRQPLEDSITESFQQLTQFCQEHRIVTSGGILKWVLVESTPQQQPDGAVIWEGFVLDVSDRKFAEEKIQQQAKQEKILREIALRIRQSLDLPDIFNTACQEIRQFIQADRVGIFKFYPDSSYADGTFVAEAVQAPFISVLHTPIHDHCFGDTYAPLYLQGRYAAMADIYALKQCHTHVLAQFQVRANLVMPLLHGNQLWGLLCVHQCSAPRAWQPSEIELTQQLANQLSIAIQQANLVKQLQQELTERQRTQRQLTLTNAELVRATRLKDEFLANMSHELRTPLNAILGMTEGLQDQVFGTINDRQLKALDTIDSSASHLLALINDILDVAKIESGHITLARAPTAIASLCQSSLSFVRQQAHQKRIQLINRLSPHLPDLEIDERRMRQVLINLLNNAVKFTPEGGQVTLTVSLENSLEVPLETGQGKSAPPVIRFSVADTGIGIAPADIAKLFQPFIQIDSALNRQYQGTGLGLTLVKQLVDLHQGQVTLISEVGVGSCFNVDLPCTLAVRPGPAGGTPPSSVPWDGRLTLLEHSPLILLAEDQADELSSLAHYLRAKGYRIVMARRGDQALALARAEQPNVVLIDSQLPEIGGLEVIRRLRTDPDLVDVPIIALADPRTDRDLDQYPNAGANQTMAKPIKLKHLTAQIHRLLTSS
jgi:PAS domain S-box-containing protein